MTNNIHYNFYSKGLAHVLCEYVQCHVYDCTLTNCMVLQSLIPFYLQFYYNVHLYNFFNPYKLSYNDCVCCPVHCYTL